MSLKIRVLDDKIKKTIEAFTSLADYEVKTLLLAQVVRSELMNQRSGNAHTKTRAEVRGGGKKPWKQKGTGRARHGSTRSPIWVGGGVTFGPRNTVNWSLKINKSSRISALKSILKDRLNENLVFQFPEEFDFPKTKLAVEVLEKLSETTGNKSKSTIVLYTTEEKLKLQGFAGSEAKLMNASNIKIVNIVNAKNVVLTPNAKKLLEERITK